MSIPVIVTAAAIILALLLRNALLKARLRGVQEAQRQINANNYRNDALQGFVKFLAIVGLFSLCILCLLLGTAF